MYNNASSCTVIAHIAGLFSLINKVVTCAELYDKVHVDFSNGTLYSGAGDNLWNHLFEPTEENGGVVIAEYPHYRYTWKDVDRLYSTASGDWRIRLNACYKKFKPLDSVDASLLQTDTAHQDIVSVLIRAGRHAGEQLSDKLPELDDYCTAIDSALACGSGIRIYLAASDDNTLELFKTRYGSIILYDERTRRGCDRSADFHEQVQQNTEDAIQCLREVLFMSKTSMLVHPISNMATAVLYINPNLKSVYIR